MSTNRHRACASRARWTALPLLDDAPATSPRRVALSNTLSNVAAICVYLCSRRSKQKEDYLTFAFVGEEDFKEMVGEQVVYGGRRLRVQAQLAARPFGSIFMLDLSVSDKLLLPPDIVAGSDLLEFIGIEPLEHRVYPVEAHIAEKLHAMTMTYEGAPSGRVKDLVDIGLLASHTSFEAASLRASIVATFNFRDTHPLPSTLPEPPEFWSTLYDEMRKEDGLEWDDTHTLLELCKAFLEPVLGGDLDGKAWSPENKQWL